jgi:hypothetical protein
LRWRRRHGPAAFGEAKECEYVRVSPGDRGHRRRCGLGAAVALSAGAARAQFGYYSPPQTSPFPRADQPLLNLARGGNPAINYYGLVRPQLEFQQSIYGLQQQVGYWRTCWQPWPYPPDWSHCCAPPPSVVLHSLPPLPAGPRAAPEAPGTQLPAPRKFDGNPPKALN